MSGDLLITLVILVAVGLSITLVLQSTYALYISLYTWDRPEAHERAKTPTRFRQPVKAFTVLLPARHEERVIAGTIESVLGANYPMHLLEVAVICSEDDAGTIAAAEGKIDRLWREGVRNTRLVTFSDGPVNKPHALNLGLRSTSQEVVTIFDAEDELHPDIFNIVNTIMLDEAAPIVQCGTQLMDYSARWYSTLNVLEYFFWFKSRLHYQAHIGAIPLGGNSVFFLRDVLEQVGGWDERNLTEDADLGIRICCLGVPVRVVYEDRYVTREETPPTLGHFVRQRSRWTQGFLQTLMKGHWLRLPTHRQKLLALYTLALPSCTAVTGLYLPVAVWMMVGLDTPVGVSMLLILPVYLLVAHFILSVIGLYEFTHAHGLRPSWLTPLRMAVIYLPYQWTLAYAALRGVGRQLRGVNSWEKTAHPGRHEQPGRALDEQQAA